MGQLLPWGWQVLRDRARGNEVALMQPYGYLPEPRENSTARVSTGWIVNIWLVICHEKVDLLPSMSGTVGELGRFYRHQRFKQKDNFVTRSLSVYKLLIA